MEFNAAVFEFVAVVCEESIAVVFEYTESDCESIKDCCDRVKA